MEAGRLRHVVELQENQPTKNSLNETIDNWVTVATLRAAISTLNGREIMAANAVGAQSTHKIEVRYHPSITAEKRVLFGTRTFDINNVNNVDERNREMILTCQESD